MTPPITGDTKIYTNMEKSIDFSRLLLIKVRDPGNGWYIDTPQLVEFSENGCDIR